MATIANEVPTLTHGDNLTQKQFLSLWETLPEYKYAELIGGVVYMPSPLSIEHGEAEASVCYWLEHYATNTPGLKVGGNVTWLMLKDAPQPDLYLRVLPEFGGPSRVKGKYLVGAPEFIAEMCVSSTSYDLHQKLNLYQAAGVKEYMTVLLKGPEVRWHRLVGRKYKCMREQEGIYRSVIFPGLWLDAAALLKDNMLRVIEVLERGLQTPAHDAFVKELASRRS